MHNKPEYKLVFGGMDMVRKAVEKDLEYWQV